jgi:hypothetical protein
MWLLKPTTQGRKELVLKRKRDMYLEGERFIREQIAGLGSYCMGKVVNNTTFPFYSVVYPLMLETGLVWVMVGTEGVLQKVIPNDEELSECIIAEPAKLEAEYKEQATIEAETISVPLI